MSSLRLVHSPNRFSTTLIHHFCIKEEMVRKMTKMRRMTREKKKMRMRQLLERSSLGKKEVTVLLFLTLKMTMVQWKTMMIERFSS